MLKKRIIAVLVVQRGIVVQSIKFRKYLPVGIPEIAVEFLNDWGVDEIMMLDISATAEFRGPNLRMVSRVAEKCRVPLTVGGGIHSLEQAKEVVSRGADKVALNQACLQKPDLVSRLAGVLGSQCVVASVDGIKTTNGHKVYDYRNNRSVSVNPVQLAEDLVKKGCGEIFIHSVDRDGAGEGFDLSLIRSVCERIHVPVIGSGGAGRPRHFVEVLKKTGAHAVAAANFFHYSEHSVTITKADILRAGVSVRHDTHADFSENKLDEDGRLKRKTDAKLESMLFVKNEKEVI